MLTLFHHPMFATCRFVRLAFGEYGEELVLIEEKPWTRRKEFLALNPAATLPVLLAEGDVPFRRHESPLHRRIDRRVWTIRHVGDDLPAGTTDDPDALIARHDGEP